ncbi:MAG: LysM domain-containing protein [Candidatus Scalindua sp.]|nr:LysM domain-containing protein [Candidatus Scalindua sp.]MDV5165729.1 LysM domain-containing protein [Candidatus Scalindua sp.]
MKRDKVFVIFIVIVSIGITSFLHFMRSPDSKEILPYLSAIESSLNVFGKGKTNEFYSFNSELEPDLSDKIIPIDYFIEEQSIIDEYEREKQVKTILYRDEPNDFISFYLALTNPMDVEYNSVVLKNEGNGASDLRIPSELVKVSVAKSDRRITHKIKANDSLFKLAKRYYNDGSKWDRIYQANKNKMSNPNSLKIGQELLIPNITITRKENKQRIIKT